VAAQTWTTLQTTLLAALVKAQPPYNVVPPDFAALFPQATSYAEARIYRDIVLLATRTQDASLVTAAASRVLSLATMTTQVIVPEGMALITPAGQTNPALGTRVWYDLADLDVIDLTWPQESVTVAPAINDWTPRYWALRDNQTMVFAPSVPGVYTVEITGLYQPAPISAANPTTYLSTVYPELLEMACLVFLTGPLTHNWSAQADDPKQALSYEGQYQTLMASARHEEMRRRGLAPDTAAPPQMPRAAA
jgi:hypothetical protein